MMKTGMISALALSLALGMVTAVEAEEWTGAHLTFGLTAAGTDLNASNGESEVSNSDSSDRSLFLAAGYDWAVGGLTLGLLADYATTEAREDLIVDGKGQVNEADWFATLRGRVGMPVNDQMQVYASGGLAFMGVSSESIGLFSTTDSATLRGRVLGLGVERMLSPGQHVTLEYLHADFGATSLDTGVSLEPVVEQIRLGYSLRF